MSTTEQLAHPERIGGYTYGTPEASRSPLTLADLDRLKAAVNLTEKDEQYLNMAGDVLADQAVDMVRTWRKILAPHPFLARYSAKPDGSPNPEYAEASEPRFARWVIDVCRRPYDQAWLDYQQEIGLRHTRAKKNQTDQVESADQIPLRYLLAFTAPVITTTKEFLRRKGHPADEVERMHEAWTKAVLLHVTVWTWPYARDGDW
jgi:hypothetical protein